MKTSRIIFAIGLCMVLFQGTAHAVIGVDDNVPAQELIFPFICEGHVDASDNTTFGSLNTLWSYAETEGHDTIVNVEAYGKKGSLEFDYKDHLTPHDLNNSDCQSLVNMMSVITRKRLLTTIEWKDYFVGYLKVSKQSQDDGVQNLIGWVTLYDPNKSSDNTGYAASSFKPYQAEGGAEPGTFAEAMGDGPMYADRYSLRFNILNSNPQTYNWWIVLRGATFCDGKSPAVCQSTTALAGNICDEDENCLSLLIPVPNTLNIINVADYIPGGIINPSEYPKRGFFSFALEEHGFYNTTGTPDPFENMDFTAFMWSYQRQQQFLKILYPTDPKKWNKFDTKYGIITDNELWSVIEPADRKPRLLY